MQPSLMASPEVVQCMPGQKKNKYKNTKIHTPTALNEQLLKLILKIWWYNEAIIPLQSADSILLTSAFS